MSFASVAFTGVSQAQVQTADDLCNSADDPCILQGNFIVENGAVLDFGDRELQIRGGSVLDVGTGTIDIRCGTLAMDVNSSIRARGTTEDTGGDISIEAGAATIAGTIDASGGPGGAVTIDVVNLLDVIGTSSGIKVDAIGTESGGGTIDVTAGELSVRAPFSATGGSFDSGGSVTLDSDGNATIAQAIDVHGGEGDGGDISITARGDVTFTQDAALSLDAAGFGFGGEVTVEAGLTATAGAGVPVGEGVLTLRGSISSKGGSDVEGGETAACWISTPSPVA